MKFEVPTETTTIPRPSLTARVLFVVMDVAYFLCFWWWLEPIYRLTRPRCSTCGTGRMWVQCEWGTYTDSQCDRCARWDNYSVTHIKVKRETQ